MLYGPDLSYIHNAGFGAFAEEAASGLLALFAAERLAGGLVVDLACGSGIWAAHALKAGYSVFGVDISQPMVEMARRHAPQGRFIVGSVHDVEIPTCVAVTAIGEGISYIPEGRLRLDLEVLIGRIFAALLPGGLFVFDVVETSRASPMRYEASREGLDWYVHVRVDEDPANQILMRRITTRRSVMGEARETSEIHRLRTYSKGELKDVLESAGFELQFTRRYGNIELHPQRLGVLAKKSRCSRETNEV